VSTGSYPRPYGSYVLLELLGKGGMSEVELARQAIGEADYVRLIVIKRIHAQHTGEDEFVKMFQDEARINAELQHENIAQVYEFGRVGEEYYLAMEFVGGMDLRIVQHHLARIGEPFPLPVVLRILHDVLCALDYAHSRVDTYGRPMHVVHRDVNPRNVMLSSRGEVKLIDFGVAKADTKSEQTVGHAIKGKYAYMAPEQIDGNVPLDGRADLFAVGLMMHELITGRSPFSGLSEVQIIHKILSGQIPDLGDIPDHPEPELLHKVHRTALKLNRDERYLTAGEMSKAIRKAAKPLGGLPRAQAMSEFLQHLDPDGASSLAERLVSYRNLDMQELTQAPRQQSIALVQAGEKSRFQGLHTQPTLVDQSEQPERRIIHGAMLALILALIFVGAAGYALWDLTRDSPIVATTASPDQKQTTPVVSEATSIPEPDTVEDPDQTTTEPDIGEVGPVDPVQDPVINPQQNPPGDPSLEPADPDANTDGSEGTDTPDTTLSEQPETTDPEHDPDSTADPELEKNTHIRILVKNPRGRSLEILIDGESQGNYVNGRRVHSVTAGSHTIQIRDEESGEVQTQKTETSVVAGTQIVQFQGAP
jgi:serine/threonine protein kinase